MGREGDLQKLLGSWVYCWEWGVHPPTSLHSLHILPDIPTFPLPLYSPPLVVLFWQFESTPSSEERGIRGSICAWYVAMEAARVMRRRGDAMLLLCMHNMFKVISIKFHISVLHEKKL